MLVDCVIVRAGDVSEELYYGDSAVLGVGKLFEELVELKLAYVGHEVLDCTLHLLQV